jgi:hypothetical protein
MEKLPVRARITDEITGVIYVVRCARELTPEEIQLAILQYKQSNIAALRGVARGESVELLVPGA